MPLSVLLSPIESHGPGQRVTFRREEGGREGGVGSEAVEAFLSPPLLRPHLNLGTITYMGPIKENDIGINM